ncbi:hypothetical protein [Pedobacter sp. ASV28]|uniref:hypothetical protein n=1 Tax=Pedobacter sp. ASV28 TaxID=2795123 RepID=UPI00351BF40F
MISKYSLIVLLTFSFNISAPIKAEAQLYSFDFYDGTFNFMANTNLLTNFKGSLDASNIKEFYRHLDTLSSTPIIESLKAYKEKHQLNDWLYYQLIRKTAEQLSPKAKNYNSYTLYKWFFMVKSGYDAKIAIGNNQIIFYVRCEEDIADIPFFVIDQKKYMCLNYHDYGKLFQREDTYFPVDIKPAEAKNVFSYKVTRMPDFTPENYEEKDINFRYKHKTFHFKLKINKQVDGIFTNYPGVDFESYFNIPLSRETYQSLIPTLKEYVKGMNTKKGVDYLMRFTRYAFLYENDDENFGKEKRLSPEQTLINNFSDCDDRAALFFYLVKEIYNLPMVALLYPTHITMAVAFDKPIGTGIYYNGKIYSICEPTPQERDLKIGELSRNLKNQQYEVVYNYQPKH